MINENQNFTTTFWDNPPKLKLSFLGQLGSIDAGRQWSRYSWIKCISELKEGFHSSVYDGKSRRGSKWQKPEGKNFLSYKISRWFDFHQIPNALENSMKISPEPILRWSNGHKNFGKSESWYLANGMSYLHQQKFIL